MRLQGLFLCSWGLWLRHSLSPRRRGPCRNEPVCWEHTFFLCLPARLQASLLRSGTNTKKPEDFHLPVLFSGEGGIRTPGSSQINGFQDRRNRPLCHLSFRFGIANIGTISFYPKLFCVKCIKKIKNREGQPKNAFPMVL